MKFEVKEAPCGGWWMVRKKGSAEVPEPYNFVGFDSLEKANRFAFSPQLPHDGWAGIGIEGGKVSLLNRL